MKLSVFRLIGGVCLSGALSVAATAQAQDIALTVDAGLRTMTNSPDTQKAIFDNKQKVAFGVGLSLDHGEHLRFGVEGRRVSWDGERAFAADRNSPAFRLGHPLEFKMTQALATVGYRFRKFGPVSPYVTAAGGVASWKEESTIAGLVESDSGTSGLFEGRLGFEKQQGHVRLALEGGITFIPGAVGVGGVSAIYEEKDLGGLFVVAKIGFSRK